MSNTREIKVTRPTFAKAPEISPQPLKETFKEEKELKSKEDHRILPASLSLEEKLLQAIQAIQVNGVSRETAGQIQMNQFYFNEALGILNKNNGEKEDKEKITEQKNTKININYSPPGGGFLHWAVKNNHPETIELLFKNGAKTFLTDKEFQTPIQYIHQYTIHEEYEPTEKEIRGGEIVEHFLEYHTPICQNDLEECISFCREYYEEGEQKSLENKTLLDYVVSRLTATNINNLFRENRNVYIAHLNSLEGAKTKTEDNKRREIEVDGWFKEKFIPLRIRSLFEIILRLDLGIIKSIDLPGSRSREEILFSFKQELLVELNSIYVEKFLLFIRNETPKKQQKHAIQLLVKNIIKQVKSLPRGQEYSFLSGWQGHAVDLGFFRHGMDLFVRIGNQGEGSNTNYRRSKKVVGIQLEIKRKEEVSYIDIPVPPDTSRKSVSKKFQRLHPVADDPSQIYPCVLGPMKDFFADEKNESLLSYMTGLAELAIDEPEKKEEDIIKKALPKIYRLDILPIGEYPHQEFKLPASKKQTISNCVVENHTVGLKIRLGSVLYDWLHLQEQRIVVTPASATCLLDEKSILNFFKMQQQPRQLPKRFKEFLKKEYQQKSKMRFLLDKSELPFEERYIDLSLEREKLDRLEEKKQERKDYQQKLSDEGEKIPAKKEPVNIPDLFQYGYILGQQLLVVGPPGVGKSIFCHYIIHRWATGKLWNDKFDWVFRINLSHLNEERYPAGKNYRLVDIIIKECFANYDVPVWAEPFLIQTLQQGNALCLLDGYDELLKPTPQHLEPVIKNLLSHSPLIITSRAYASEELNINTRVEITGFSDISIKKYIEKVFPMVPIPEEKKQSHSLPAEQKNQSILLSVTEEKLENTNATTATMLLDFLQKNPRVLEIASAPINLALICCLYSDASSRNFSNDITLTELYYKIMMWLLQKDLTNKGSAAAIVKVEDRVLRARKEELSALEKIAFYLTNNPDVRLTQEKFEEQVPSIKEAETRYGDIVAMGLLNPASHERHTHYNFLHATFRDFLAARYLISSLNTKNDTQPRREAIQFIQTKKYHPNFTQLFSFAAGLFSLDSKQTEGLSLFWNTLQLPPRDLIGVTHRQLMEHYLKEAKFDERISHKNNILIECHLAEQQDIDRVRKRKGISAFPFIQRGYDESEKHKSLQTTIATPAEMEILLKTIHENAVSILLKEDSLSLDPITTLVESAYGAYIPRAIEEIFYTWACCFKKNYLNQHLQLVNAIKELNAKMDCDQILLNIADRYSKCRQEVAAEAEPSNFIRISRTHHDTIPQVLAKTMRSPEGIRRLMRSLLDEIDELKIYQSRIDKKECSYFDPYFDPYCDSGSWCSSHAWHDGMGTLASLGSTAAIPEVINGLLQLLKETRSEYSRYRDLCGQLSEKEKDEYYVYTLSADSDSPRIGPIIGPINFAKCLYKHNPIVQRLGSYFVRVPEIHQAAINTLISIGACTRPDVFDALGGLEEIFIRSGIKPQRYQPGSAWTKLEEVLLTPKGQDSLLRMLKLEDSRATCAISLLTYARAAATPQILMALIPYISRNMTDHDQTFTLCHFFIEILIGQAMDSIPNPNIASWVIGILSIENIDDSTLPMLLVQILAEESVLQMENRDLVQVVNSDDNDTKQNTDRIRIISTYIRPSGRIAYILSGMLRDNDYVWQKKTQAALAIAQLFSITNTFPEYLCSDNRSDQRLVKIITEEIVPYIDIESSYTLFCESVSRAEICSSGYSMPPGFFVEADRGLGPKTLTKQRLASIFSLKNLLPYYLSTSYPEDWTALLAQIAFKQNALLTVTENEITIDPEGTTFFKIEEDAKVLIPPLIQAFFGEAQSWGLSTNHYDMYQKKYWAVLSVLIRLVTKIETGVIVALILSYFSKKDFYLYLSMKDSWSQEENLLILKSMQESEKEYLPEEKSDIPIVQIQDRLIIQSPSSLYDELLYEETFNDEYEILEPDTQPLRWDCFDVAIGLATELKLEKKDSEKARKALVDYAINKHEELQYLLEPEICRATILTAAYLNRQGEKEEKKTAQNYLLPRNMREKYEKEIPKLMNNAQALRAYCLREDIYKEYVQSYYGENGWVAFQSHRRPSSSMVDIAAKFLNARIIIYREKKFIIYKTNANSKREIHIQFDGHGGFLALKHCPKVEEKKDISRTPSPTHIAPTQAFFPPAIKVDDTPVALITHPAPLTESKIR